MKKILLSFFAFLLMAVTAFAQDNLLANGDFENWTDGKPNAWVSVSSASNATLSQVTDGVHGGSAAVSVGSAAKSNKRMATQEYDLAAGTYTFSVWAKGGAKIRLGYAIVDVAGDGSYSIDSNKGYVYVTDAVETSTEEWTQYSCEFTLEATTKVNLMVVNSKSTLPLWVDDAVLTVVGGEEGGGEGGGETPDEPEVPGVLWSESFGSSIGTFTIEDKSKDEALSNVWSFASGYGMKATGYANKTNYAAESWLVSPVLDLTNATDCSIAFQQAANFFKNQDNLKAAVSVKAKAAGDADWTTLDVTPWHEGTSWTFIPSTADLKAFDGKQVQIAFVYTSTADMAGTWEVKEFNLHGNGSVSLPDEPETPEVSNYTNVADLVAAATADKVDVTYEFTDLLVTGVGVRGSNTSVYVNDGKALLLYGAATTFKKGDKISGKLAGQLCVYNNVTELVVASYEGVTVSSSDNAVEPAVVTIADVNNDETYLYQNQYVQLQGVFFTAEALDKSNITMMDDSDNEMVLRDNFNVLGDVIFNTSKTYNVSGYVAYYNGKAQLYACEASDVQMITNLKNAETAWAAEEVVVLPSDEQKVDNALTTLSDGEKTYASSNPAVATVDAEGNITLTGKGVTVISVETAETDNYLESKASFTLFVIEGEGTFEAPYTPADVQYFNGKATEKVWVKGQILGSINGSAIYPASDTEKTVASNIAIGTADLYVPVQLSSGSDVRAALNLIDNPELQDATVWVYGSLETYFSMPGVKSTSDFSLDGQTGIVIAIEQPATGEKQIYSIDGRRLTKLTKGINIVNGKKVLY
ncbi:MAG: DUF6359 domain-containing protein [Alloprevotella sp.]|nr:DUF6359 domain-containing protein [Alloprevotella sp.]